MPVGEPFVKRSAGESEIVLRKLTPYDRAELLRREKARQRAAMLQNLKDVGADKAEMIDTLSQFDAQNDGMRDFYAVFDSIAGKADIFDLASSEMKMASPGRPEWKQRPDAEDVTRYVTGLEPNELVKLAAELCAIPLGSPADEEPDTYGEPQGGETNPTLGETDPIPATTVTT